MKPRKDSADRGAGSGCMARLVRCSSFFWGGNVGSGKTVEADLDRSGKPLDLLAYALQCTFEGTHEVPVLYKDKLHFWPVQEGNGYQLARGITFTLQDQDRCFEVHIPRLVCVDEVKVTSFGNGKRVQEVAVLRVAHECERAQTDGVAGAMLIDQSQYIFVGKQIARVIEELPRKILKRGIPGQQRVERCDRVTMTLHTTLLFLLALGQKIRRICTRARTEESGEKADKPIDDDFKNGGAGHVFNSAPNVRALAQPGAQDSPNTINDL
jgi:hypothetical protein